MFWILGLCQNIGRAVQKDLAGLGRSENRKKLSTSEGQSVGCQNAVERHATWHARTYAPRGTA